MSKIGRKIIRIPENIKVLLQEKEIILSKENQILKIKKPAFCRLVFKNQCLSIEIPKNQYKIREKDQINMFW